MIWDQHVKAEIPTFLVAQLEIETMQMFAIYSNIEMCIPLEDVPSFRLWRRELPALLCRATFAVRGDHDFQLNTRRGIDAHYGYPNTNTGFYAISNLAPTVTTPI